MAYRGFRHFGLKFLSIVLAALLWLVVSGEQVVERVVRIPLEFTNLPARLEMVGDTPAVVDVRVRGSSGSLSRLAPGELVAVLDVRSARPGRRLFHVTGTDVRSPFGVEVVQVSPASLSVAFEESASKVVPVKPVVEGEPREGFVVGAVTSDPATVEVVGPVSSLGKLTEAITEPVSVAGASAPVHESVTIGVLNPGVRLRTPQSAAVTVNVVAAPVEHRISEVPVEAKGGRNGARLVPERVTVVLRGAREVVDTVRPSDIVATVDLDGLGPGQFQLPVRVGPPARLTVVRVEPPQVQVRVR
ncbi:MAG TPA: CdaR family protein [Vicinamibacterales bacterium]|jgi:YbbR domain-containing protein